jgi:hypothetical protein
MFVYQFIVGVEQDDGKCVHYLEKASAQVNFISYYTILYYTIRCYDILYAILYWQCIDFTFCYMKCCMNVVALFSTDVSHDYMISHACITV